MELSVFDLFKIGIGPSSSHTVGPMWAAYRFLQVLVRHALLERAVRVRVDFYGALALTGKGHATDAAVLLGLAGERPDTVDPDAVKPRLALIRSRQAVPLAGQREIPFQEAEDIVFHRQQSLPRHPNGMTFSAFGAPDGLLAEETYYSVGGGFVVSETEGDLGAGDQFRREPPPPYPFSSAAELLAIGRQTGKSIAEIVRENETAWRSPAEIDAGLDRIWAVMEQCIEHGCRGKGVLPGGLNVRRRAGRLFDELQARSEKQDPLVILDWVSLFALRKMPRAVGS
jgi:L-serine dehydratase